MSTHQVAYAQKRRSTRIEQSIPLVVQGVGALREPYQEQVSTISISCHGCAYISKHEVIQGETVYLDVKPPSHGAGTCSSRARVKWAQKTGTGKERAFQIAVELEIFGNIWGIPTPPPDWFPPQLPETADPAALGRELKVVARKDQPALTAPEAAPARVVRPTVRNDVAVPASSPAANPIAQLMVGLGEQIQTMAAEAAASALIKEKSRLLEEFRGQLRDEAVKAIQSAITASREAIVRQTTKDLGEAHEAGIRQSHALWRKQIEQDMESVRQHLLIQGKEVTQRLETVAITTIERVQSKMEATRTEAVDRFVSRIREQVVPMLAEAKDSLVKLQGAESALKKESQAIFAELEHQLAITTNLCLAKAQEDVEQSSAAIVARTTESLAELQQKLEKVAHDNANALLASLGGQLNQTLQEKAAEASREFSRGIEGYTRNYLESISKSIAEIPRTVSKQPSK